MKFKKKKTKSIVLSLGGSLVVPDRINLQFLRKFKKFVLKHLERGRKFIIVVGGGKVCRRYQSALTKITPAPDEDLDWFGIHITRINAELVQRIFGKRAYSEIITNPYKKIRTNKRIILSGGWRSGRTTDFVAVALAKKYGAEQVINMTDVSAVYNKDPDKFSDAKPFKQLTWSQYFKIFGKKHRPGASYPFGLTASQLAKKLAIKVIILKGSNLKNLDKVLAGKNFKGTTIS